MNDGDYLEMVTTKHMRLTQHACYKSVTQRIQKKCFDLPVRSPSESPHCIQIISFANLE